MVDYTLEHTPMTEEREQELEREFSRTGIRTWMLSTYAIPGMHYAQGTTPPQSRKSLSAVRTAEQLGAIIYYGCHHPGTKRKIMVDIQKMVEKWHALVVGLAVAHDKDEADRYEAMVDECLTPVLRCPVKQLREFAGALRDSLKSDPKVPYLVWHGMEVWIDMVILLAPDEEVKELKTELAREIVSMVEDDAKRDLPAAMIRALQWRSPEQLEKVKKVVATEKEAGRPVRLKGRESCLFLEAGGTEDAPAVCIQV